MVFWAERDSASSSAGARPKNAGTPGWEDVKAGNLLFGFIGLVFVSLKNRHYQWSKFFLQLLASRRILKFNALAFTANQASFPKNLEMLRQRGLGNFHVAIGQKGGAVHGAVSLGQFRADANPDGVGQGIQNALHGYFIQRRMIKWPHGKKLSQLDMVVQ